jgi:hypothetical protein
MKIQAMERRNEAKKVPAAPPPKEAFKIQFKKKKNEPEIVSNETKVSVLLL